MQDFVRSGWLVIIMTSVADNVKDNEQLFLKIISKFIMKQLNGAIHDKEN